MSHCLSCWDDPCLGLTLVFSQFQVLLCHLWERREEKGRKEGRRSKKKKRRKERKKELKNIKKKKKKSSAGFKLAKIFLLVFLASAGLEWNGFTFHLSCGFVGCGPGLGRTLCSCPASSPVPQFTALPPVPFCAWPIPSAHQLCCP